MAIKDFTSLKVLAQELMEKLCLYGIDKLKNSTL
jgi:hypothetical protein